MKSLIIVGNGNGVLSSNKKDFINSCDLVVRINNFKITNYENYVGTKTDIYSCTPKYITSIDLNDEQLKKDAIMRYEEELKECPQLVNYKEKYIAIYTHPKIESNILNEIWLSFSSHNDLIKKEMQLFPNDKFPYERLPFSSKIRICNFGATLKHTTGFKTLMYCLKNYPTHQIYMTGFDFYLKSGWYWDIESWFKQHLINPSSSHCYTLEKVKVDNFIKDGRVKII